jgi:hypothetical protein
MADVTGTRDGQVVDGDPALLGDCRESDCEAARSGRHKQMLGAPVPARAAELGRDGDVDLTEVGCLDANKLPALPANGDREAEVLCDAHDSLLSWSPESSRQALPVSSAAPPIEVAGKYGRDRAAMRRII